jgi:caffeoyl-CoA O-methyltransferase
VKDMSALESELEQYILSHIDPEEDLLAELNRLTHLKVMHPRMLSGHLQGKILRMISLMIHPDQILEIGTFTGYSAICLAQGLSDGGQLHTIEINDELTDIPKLYFEKFGLTNHIKMYHGDARLIIPTLHDNFDLVFLDGDKSEYPDYYKLVFDKVKHGGFILADNILWSGKVVEKTTGNDYFTKGIKIFNDLIFKDKRVEKVILPIRDGLMILRKL